jgi:hypothetical protein
MAMPKQTPTLETPSDFPNIDLAGRYLEYMRLREIVENEERRTSHMSTGINPKRKDPAHLKVRRNAR